MSDYLCHKCVVNVDYHYECGACNHCWYGGTIYHELIACPECGEIGYVLLK